MNELLTFHDVDYSYHSMQGETHAIDHMSFTVYNQEFLVIVGPSGCGKSTLLDLIAGQIHPQKGQITGVNDSIGYMLQKDHLFEWRTIEKNILLGLEIQKKKNRENLALANALLKKYDLYDFRQKYPRELSGGMRQRAALIRTLVTSPELLLLDEPFSALDYQTRLQVADDIGRIIRSEKKTAILVTHDLSEAISMGDRILVLSVRPAKVVREIRLDFDPSLSSIERRETDAFKRYFSELWKEMNADGTS
ncbi:MAG: ABC transporter ATP-binding protein [Lachnospiraceae bacterium]|nr:ABC transporter ATP-binding protein [Lachnospiraceae bacterium]